jgi:hypothetical protein
MKSPEVFQVVENENPLQQDIMFALGSRMGLSRI